MNIFVYSDESGVFDKIHNEHFVFGGLIFLGKDFRDEFSRRYSNAEKTIRTFGKYTDNAELKACRITNKEKNKLYRSLNHCYKFGAVIHQKYILDNIFASKKDKQRYLDFAYKIAVKRAFERMIYKGIINPEQIENIYFYVDEHTTATNGRYELQEGLEQEFKFGTYNHNFSIHFPPIFPNMKQVIVFFCNSDSNFLIRAADIVSNHIYFKTRNEFLNSEMPNNLYITNLPTNIYISNEEKED